MAAVRFVTRKWPPAVGGMETYSARLVEELSKQVPVEVLALPGRTSGHAPSTVALLMFGLRTALQLLRSPAADVVHVGDLASWPLAWLASLRHPRSRIVISAHGSDVSFAFRKGWRGGLYRTYIRTGAAVLRRARIIANSHYIAGLARGVGFERLHVVPLATDFFAPGSSSARRHLLYAGRITQAKGLRFLIEAVLPLLPEDVRLRVAGTVGEESERALLANPRVDDLGTLSPRDLSREFAGAVAVLVPTRESEGFGLVAIEAAACGAPVVASGHSGLVDVVQDAIGVTVAADDASAWAAAIRAALSRSDAERQRHAAAAIAQVDRLYRWPRVASETLRVYDSD